MTIETSDSIAGANGGERLVRMRPAAVPSRRFSVLAAAEAYWRGLAPPGCIPHRRAVAPRDFGPSLCHIYMATIVASGVARLRFAGRDVAGIFGMEVRGMPISALFDPGSRVRVHDAIDRAVRGPAIVELPLEMRQGALRRPRSGRMSLLPLCDETGVVTRLMGAMVFDGQDRGGGRVQVSVPTTRSFRVERLVSPNTPPAAPDRGSRRPDVALRLVVDNA